MNKVFNIIWHHATQSWIVVSELARGSVKSSSRKTMKLLAVSTIVPGAVLLTSNDAFAAISQSGNGVLRIDDKAQVTFKDWNQQVILGGSYTDENGTYNITSNPNTYGIVSIGYGSNVTAFAGVAVGTRTTANNNAAALGYRAQAAGKYSTAVGTVSEANALGSTSLGDHAIVDATSERSMTIGSYSNVTGSSHATAIGIGSNIKDSASAFLLGSSSNISNAPDSIGIGNKANITNAESSISIGNENNIQSNNSVVIGNNVNVPAGLDNSVVLGNASTTEGSHPVTTNVYNATLQGITYGEFAGKTNGAGKFVSVGSNKEGEQRRIINVAAGNIDKNSTDAINGSQLYMVANKLGAIIHSLGEQTGLPVPATSPESDELYAQPTFKPLKNIDGTNANVSTTLKDAIGKNIDKLNEGLHFGANQDEANSSNKTQYLGSKLDVKAGDVTNKDNNKKYSGKNLWTEYKYENGNGTITVGLSDNPEFSSVKINPNNVTNVTINPTGKDPKDEKILTIPDDEDALKNAVSLADLKNYGWIVGTPQDNNKSAVVRNASTVNILGEGLAKVTGDFNSETGVNNITVSVKLGEVSTTNANNPVLKKDDNTEEPVTKVGDNYYLNSDLDDNGLPKADATPLTPDQVSNVSYPAGNKGDGLVTGNQVGDAIAQSGWTLGKATDAEIEKVKDKLSDTAENSVEKINPNDNVRFTDGTNTKVKLGTYEVKDENGAVSTTSVVRVDVDGLPMAYTNKDGDKIAKGSDGNYYKVDPTTGLPSNKPEDLVKPENITVSAVNPTAEDGKVGAPTTITNVAAGAKTKNIETNPKGDNSTPAEKILNLDTDPANQDSSNPNNVVTVEDLKNYGWIVGTPQDNNKSAVVRNASTVNILGEGLAKVTGDFNSETGVNNITVSVKLGEVSTTNANNPVLKKDDNTEEPVTKVGDNYYLNSDLDDNGLPKADATPLTPDQVSKVSYPAGNKGDGLVTGNQVGDAIAQSGWTLGKATDAEIAKVQDKLSDTAENSVEKINPNDNVRFTDGTNTKVKLGTYEVKDANGTVSTTTVVRVDVDGLPMAYTNEKGEKIAKASDGNYYKVDPTTGLPSNKPEDFVEPANITVSAINPNAPEGSAGEPTKIANVDNGLNGVTNVKDKTPITADNATKAIAGTDGKSGLLTQKDGLDKVATVGDLQALAVAGLDFNGNNGDEKVHRALGTQLSIKGEDPVYTDAANKTFESAKGNINVHADASNNTLEVQLAKNLTNVTSVSSEPKDGKATTIQLDPEQGMIVSQAPDAPTVTIKPGKTPADKPEIAFSKEGKITGLEARNPVNNVADYGKGDNANRAATEGAVKAVNDKISGGIQLSGNNYNAGNDNTVAKKGLGERLEIVGGYAGTDATARNTRTEIKDGKLEVQISEKPVFQEVTAEKQLTVGTGNKQAVMNGTSLSFAKNANGSGSGAIRGLEARNPVDNADYGKGENQYRAATEGAVNNVNNRVTNLYQAANRRADDLERKVDRVEKRGSAGTASALASAGLLQAYKPGQSVVSVGTGYYHSQSALAVGYSRLADSGKIGIKVSAGMNSRGEASGNAAIGYFW